MLLKNYTKRILVAGIFIFLGGDLQAETYTITNSGNWTSKSNWTGEYPGKHVSKGDTVYIQANIKVNRSLIVEGVLIVEDGALLQVKKYLEVDTNGVLINHGWTLSKGIENYGEIMNESLIETAKDIMNWGYLINNESVICRRDLYNQNGVWGEKGIFWAKDRIVCASNAWFSGHIDLYAFRIYYDAGEIVRANNRFYCSVNNPTGASQTGSSFYTGPTRE